MDIFEERYFNVNRRLFVAMGLWSSGSRSTRNVRKYILLIVLFLITLLHVSICYDISRENVDRWSFNFPQLISVTVNFRDVDRLMLNLVIFFITLFMFLKMLAMIVAQDKMTGLYGDIADNWLAIVDERERWILVEYSTRGRKKTIFYIVFMGIGALTLFVLPIVPKLFNLISPSANAPPSIQIFESELLIDREAYYWLYYLSDFLAINVNSAVSVSVDTMFVVCVEHCCALYAIIKHRLRGLGRLKPMDISKSTEVDSYDYAVSIIRLHQIALNFTSTIKKTYTLLFVYLFIENILCIPLVAVTVLRTLDNLLNCVRFMMLFNIFAVHLFMFFWPGQNILDHSYDLIDDAYYSEWYATPLRTRKMIITLMIRCSPPAVLDAGGLVLMNFVNFSMIVRTAISYITVVASFRY